MGKQKGLDVAYTVYTEELFDLCYPNASLEERYHFFMVTDEEKIQTLEQRFQQKIRNVRRVVLDEEFLVWLKQQNLANNEQSRSLYAEQISATKAEELWVKNEFHREVLPMLLPVVVSSTTSVIPANEIAIKEKLMPSLRAHLAATYRAKPKDVWVYPGLTRADVWDEMEEYRFYEAMFDYFENPAVQYTAPRMLVPQKDINIDMRFIPVAVVHTTSATTTAQALKNEWETTPHIKSCETISKKFGYPFEAAMQPYAITIDEAMDVRQEFIGCLEEDAKEYGIPFMVK